MNISLVTVQTDLLKVWKYVIKTINPYRWHLLIALVLGAYIYYQNNEYQKLDLHHREVENELETMTLVAKNYEGCQTISPYGDPPLRITFSDQRVAYVNFFHVAVPTGKLKIDDPQWRYLEAVIREQLSNDLKAEVYTELEGITLENARRNRLPLGKKIFQKVQSTASALDYVLVQFEFLEFCEPSTVSQQEFGEVN